MIMTISNKAPAAFGLVRLSSLLLLILILELVQLHPSLALHFPVDVHCPHEDYWAADCVNDQDGADPPDAGCPAERPYCLTQDGHDPRHGTAGQQCRHCVTISSWCTDDWLALSDEELFAFRGDDTLSSSGMIGDYCHVHHRDPGEIAPCEYYVVGSTSPSGLLMHGVPRTTPDDDGTGCVKMNHRHDDRTVCYFDNVHYNLTSAERRSMCTNDTVANAAAQLRHGIRHAPRYCVEHGTFLSCLRFMDSDEEMTTTAVSSSNTETDTPPRTGSMMMMMGSLVVLLGVWVRQHRRRRPQWQPQDDNEGAVQLTNIMGSSAFQYTSLGSGCGEDH